MNEEDGRENPLYAERAQAGAFVVSEGKAD